MSAPPLSLDACDPKQLMRAALAGAGGWTPRELFLAWLLALPTEIDAAHAAAVILHQAPRRASVDPAVTGLVALLRSTASYPRERLAALARPHCRLN